MSIANINDIYMRRALYLASLGAGYVSPNPMVGAVICSPDGRIIGEGWHRNFGGPHAEVWAVRSVSEADKYLLPDSTIYVTLEPCSHYGKTPPCAKMLIDIGIGRVVVGAGDPNPKVSGRGVKMIREAGIEVVEGILAQESEELNKTFMLSQRLRRPFVTLKWAQSSDGVMDCKRDENEAAARFSTAQSSIAVHCRRAMADAIAVGADTALADNPSLTVRALAGRNPRPVLLDRHNKLNTTNCTLLTDPRNSIHATDFGNNEELLHYLFEKEGISSILIEGGSKVLSSFIADGLWDEAYVETSPQVLSINGRTAAPSIPLIPTKAYFWGENRIDFYSHKKIKHVKNI